MFCCLALRWGGGKVDGGGELGFWVGSGGEGGGRGVWAWGGGRGVALEGVEEGEGGGEGRIVGGWLLRCRMVRLSELQKSKNVTSDMEEVGRFSPVVMWLLPLKLLMNSCIMEVTDQATTVCADRPIIFTKHYTWPPRCTIFTPPMNNKSAAVLQ